MTRLCFAFVLLTGCVTTQSNTTGNQAPGQGSDEQMECHDEAPTGTTITHQVCRRKQDTQEQRNSDTVTRQLETPRMNPGKPGN